MIENSKDYNFLVYAINRDIPTEITDQDIILGYQHRDEYYTVMPDTDDLEKNYKHAWLRDNIHNMIYKIL